MAKWVVIPGGYNFFDEAKRPYGNGSIIDDEKFDIKGQEHKLVPWVDPDAPKVPEKKEETRPEQVVEENKPTEEKQPKENKEGENAEASSEEGPGNQSAGPEQAARVSEGQKQNAGSESGGAEETRE